MTPDPFEIPALLDRRGEPVKLRPYRAPRKRWVIPKSAKQLAEKKRAQETQELRNGDVLTAIKAGADTFGKIRNATGIDDNRTIRIAIRRLKRDRQIEQVGRRYRRT